VGGHTFLSGLFLFPSGIHASVALGRRFIRFTISIQQYLALRCTPRQLPPAFNCVSFQDGSLIANYSRKLFLSPDSETAFFRAALLFLSPPPVAFLNDPSREHRRCVHLPARHGQTMFLSPPFSPMNISSLHFWSLPVLFTPSKEPLFISDRRVTQEHTRPFF